MIRVRLTTWTLCVVLVAAGVAVGQQQTRLTPTTAALRLSSKLEKGESDYDHATRTIALSYWRRGEYDAAFAQIENLKPYDEAGHLSYFASSAIKSGQAELARKALDRGLKLLTSGDEDAHDTGYIRDFAEVAVKLNDLDLAARFTDELDEGSARKAFTLVRLAEARAARNEKDKAVAFLDQALQQTSAFDDSERHELVDLYAKAVEVLVTLGEKDRAIELAGRANELLLSEAKPDDRDRSRVALSFARLGEFPRAMAVLESFDEDSKADSLISLASVYQAKGDETAAVNSLLQARAILESSSDGDYQQAMKLNHLVEAYLRIGKLDEAFEIVRETRDPYYLAKTATVVATSFFARHRRQDAGATLDFAFAEIRKIVSEKSEDIPDMASTSTAQTKSRALTDLGEKYIEIGDPRGAEAAAMAIDHPQYKASLLARVAVAYAKDGDKAKAKSLLATAFKLSSDSEDYSHDTPRAYALSKVAEAYALAGFKQDSANTILRLLRELRDRDDNAFDIECLIEVGLMAEAKGVPMNRNIQKMLEQVVAKAEDDN